MTQRAAPLRQVVLAVVVLATVSACAYPGQNRYYGYNVGYPMPVQFGTVVSSRQIEIKGTPTGLGAAAGGAAGGLGGAAIGAGLGSAFAALGLALVGLGVGALAEQAVTDQSGIEYTIALETGQVFSLVQNMNAGDTIIAPGHRVMVQYGRGYTRIVPADNIPTSMQRPQGLIVH